MATTSVFKILATEVATTRISNANYAFGVTIRPSEDIGIKKLDFIGVNSSGYSAEMYSRIYDMSTTSYIAVGTSEMTTVNTNSTSGGVSTQFSVPVKLEKGKTYFVSLYSTNYRVTFVSKVLKGVENSGTTQIEVPTVANIIADYTMADVRISDPKMGNGLRGVLEMSITYEDVNPPPEIKLINPTDNKTLYENDTFSISGTASDADNGNTVTIRYQINAETVRSIDAFISDGITAKSFAKSITFKSGKLYDGETAITGNLTDGVAHKLKVWVTDDQGSTSAIVERDFYVVPNRAPSLTVEPPVITGNIDSDKFTVNGTYNDADGNATTVKYRINGGNSVQVASGTSGAFDFEVSFAQLVTGPNTIVIEAIDSYGAKTSKTVKMNKNVVKTAQLRSTARYKILPPAKTAQAVLLWIERDKDLVLDVAVSMTMAGEAESFVPVTVSESVPIATGSNTYEDTFFYEADAPKDNIIVQIDMTRKTVDADDKITLISGVLE